MSLSSLIRKRNILIQDTTLPKARKILETHYKVSSESLGGEWQKSYELLQSTLNNHMQLTKQGLDTIRQEIAVLEPQCIQRTDDIYASRVRMTAADAITNAQAWLPDSKTIEEVQFRIGHHANWQYPGLEVEPKLGTFTRSLSSLEPLYLLTQYQRWLRLLLNNFQNNTSAGCAFMATNRTTYYRTMH
jgi:hypothetical protein